MLSYFILNFKMEKCSTLMHELHILHQERGTCFFCSTIVVNNMEVQCCLLNNNYRELLEVRTVGDCLLLLVANGGGRE